MSRAGTIPPKADPWRRLAAALVNQAVKDLQSPDTLQALDALLWFVDDQAEVYLTALDVWPSNLLDKAVSYDN